MPAVSGDGPLTGEPPLVGEPPLDGVLYLDACATTPPAAAVLEAQFQASARAWANPSSLHPPGLAAADRLERSRIAVGDALGCEADRVIFCSGGSEAIHGALLGAAAGLEPGRLLLSSVEHPATTAAARWLLRLGWRITTLPVDRRGVVLLDQLDALLAPPTRLVSLIWGQSEVGALQPIEVIGARCREAGILLHVDAVQVVGHQRMAFSSLPVDLLSCTAHKLRGPRGIGALLVAPGVALEPLIGGGGREGGGRGGTEPVALAAGFAAALGLAGQRLERHGGQDPMAGLRDVLLERLLELPGVELTGPHPRDPDGRLPHHLSLLVRGSDGSPLSGRALVRALGRRGIAVGSGSACSNRQGAPGGRSSASPVLLAMGYDEREAGAGLRLSLGSWLSAKDLEGVPAALGEARREVERQVSGGWPAG